MRVIQALESAGPGGAERVLSDLTLELRRRGHELSVFLLRTGWLHTRLLDQGIDVTIMPIERPLDPRFLGALRRKIRGFGADVFHSHEFTFALYGRLACATLGVPQVATAHGANFAGGPKRCVLGTALLRRSSRFRLAAVSKDLGLRIARRLAAAPDSIAIVPNGVSPVAVPSPGATDDSGTLRLVAVGNLYPVKNHALLVQAVAILRRRGIPATLDVLGRGAEQERLQSSIARAGLEDAVRLHGFREDVAAFLSRSDVFVSSSLSEGMPMSFLEAMIHGLPIVASRVGGVGELVRDGDNGLTFRSGSLDGLVRALTALAADAPLRRRLGRNAAELVNREFSTSRMADRYLDLYSAVAPGVAARPRVSANRPHDRRHAHR